MNLLSKLHKNSILTGPIESYCLACGCLLRSEEDSYAHIHNPDHAEKLQTVTQLENYKDDCILKSKEGYYCPYCNIILPTIKRVSLHVTDLNHRDNKNSQSITRHAGVIFAFDAVVIDPRSWQGLDGSTCSVCDQDYADEELHKKEATHILNLIQAKCEYGENFIYRKVDEDLFFCLICNDILSVLEKPTHHESEKHLQLYENSKKEGIAIRNQKLGAIELNDYKVASVKYIDSKVAKETSVKPKTPENITQNGSPDIIDNNTTATQKNIHGTINLNTESVQETAKLKTEKVPKQESKSDPQSKPQEATKIDTQENKLDKTTQETTEINSEKKTQVLRLNAPTKNTQDTAKLNAAKVSNSDSKNKNTQTHTKLNTEKIPQEFKDKPKSLNTNTAVKAIEAKKSEIVSSKVVTETSDPKTSASNGTSKVETDKSEPYLYQYLKARNFVIKAYDGAAFCTLCDISVNEDEVGIHSLEKHHNILYAKHVARKNSKLSEKNLNRQDGTKDIDSETSLKTKASTVKGKENAVPVIKQASKDNDEPAEVSKEIVAKDSKITDKNTVVEQANNIQIKAQYSKITNKTAAVIEQTNTAQIKVQDSKLNKENTVPENNAPNGISIDKTDEETQESKPGKTDTAQHKKTNKNARKKAAKAKTSKTKNLLHGSNDRGIPNEVFGPGTDVTTAELGSLTGAISTTLVDKSKPDDKVQINGLHSKNDSENVKDADSKKDAQINGLIASHADLKTEKLLELIKTVSQVDSAPDDVVINSKYVLGNLSFVLIVRSDNKTECVACNEELTFNEIHSHIVMDDHRSNVEECLVVTSLDDEFIRQVKTQEYHCGYCNMVLPNWKDTELHLQTFRHSDAKTSASWRLERYHPHLRHCQTREVRSILSTIFRCTRE